MNMKRGLVFSLCALAVAASASSAMAQATIDVSLNLRYSDPADPAEGGTWQLVAKTGDDDGIAGLVVYLQNAGTAASTTMASNIGALANVGNPPGPALLDRTGGVLEVVYGQDLTAAGTVLDVGQPNFGPRIVNDALKNTAWNNVSLIASGSFGATRPTFVSFQGNPADGNTLPDMVNGTTPAEDANVTTIVRGDAARVTGVEGAGKGLFQGDANRDGAVNSADLSLLLTNFNGSNKTWGEGNFNDDAGGAGVVNSADLSLLLTNFNQSGIPVSVSAIPEPSTALLAGVAAMLGLAIRRRS
jgi:hypothetical protein